MSWTFTWYSFPLCIIVSCECVFALRILAFFAAIRPVDISARRSAIAEVWGFMNTGIPRTIKMNAVMVAISS